MKKIVILLIMFTLILTGCSSEYNLEFSNSKIKENIKVDILDSDIPKADPYIETELDDRVTPFIENEQYPFFKNENIKYNKKVEKNGSITTVTLDYEYSHDEFKKSTTYNTCFENSVFNINKKKYDLSLSGSFYCLYGEELAINIKTNNEVLSHNADKVSGNVYTWIINNDNVNDVDIEMSISKKTKMMTSLIYVIISGMAVVFAIVSYGVYKKIKDRDIINDI